MRRVLLFGSRVGGQAGPRSDFDIAVDGPGPLDLHAFYAIAEGLDRMPTLYSVDWMDLNRVSSKVSDNARRKGRVIYEG